VRASYFRVTLSPVNAARHSPRRFSIAFLASRRFMFNPLM
jgi:hypothetical protein